MPLMLISTILQIISSSGVAGDVVTKLTGFVAAVLGRGDATEASLKKLLAQVEAMIAEKRGPKASEWAEWDARLDAAHDRIQGA